MVKACSPPKQNLARSQKYAQYRLRRTLTLDKLFVAQPPVCPLVAPPTANTKSVGEFPFTLPVHRRLEKGLFTPSTGVKGIASPFCAKGDLRQKKLLDLFSAQPAITGYKLSGAGLRQTRLRFPEDEKNEEAQKRTLGSVTTASCVSPNNAMGSFTFENMCGLSRFRPARSRNPSIATRTINPPIAAPNNTFMDPQLNEKFEVLNVLGEGAFAVVRQCKCRTTGRHLAVKSYRHTLQTALFEKTVQNEIRVLRAAQHPHIVELIGVMRTRCYTHLFLELLEGQTLEQVIRDAGGALSLAEARRIFKQLLDAVNYLHRERLYHRDLKIENVMISEKGHLKLIDFGFALNVAQSGKSPLICGTPNYMAPEAFNEVSVDPAAVETWALGVLLYRLICGEFPFKPKYPENARSPLQYSYIRHSLISDDRLNDLFERIFAVCPTNRISLCDISNHRWVLDK